MWCGINGCEVSLLPFKRMLITGLGQYTLVRSEESLSYNTNPYTRKPLLVETPNNYYDWLISLTLKNGVIFEL